MPTPEPTIVYYPAPEPLTNEEMVSTIGLALDANPRLQQAMRQFLQERLARAAVENAQPDLTERAAGHASGRLAEILSLQRELANYTNRARELAGPRRPAAATRDRVRGS
jgi:hypothetical protein